MVCQLISLSGPHNTGSKLSFGFTYPNLEDLVSNIHQTTALLSQFVYSTQKPQNAAAAAYVNVLHCLLASRGHRYYRRQHLHVCRSSIASRSSWQQPLLALVICRDVVLETSVSVSRAFETTSMRSWSWSWYLWSRSWSRSWRIGLGYFQDQYFIWVFVFPIFLQNKTTVTEIVRCIYLCGECSSW